MRKTSQKGFTLAEALLATVVVAIALCGIMAAYVGCTGFLNTSKIVNIATNYAQGLMEQIRNTPFPQIPGFMYPPKVPNLTALNIANSVVVSVNVTNPVLYQVTISVCWKQNNRIFGVEDANGNCTNSPTQLVTLIADR